MQVLNGAKPLVYFETKENRTECQETLMIILLGVPVDKSLF